MERGLLRLRWSRLVHLVLVVTLASFGAPFIAIPAAYAATGSISGTVYEDTNGNGTLDAGETGIIGRTVFEDTNTNGILDAGEVSTTTNSFGSYLLTVNSGTTTVATVKPSNWTTTQPSGSVAVSSGATTSNVNIGEFHLGSVAGTIYEDSNGNGVRNAGDVGVSGLTVYLDSNANGTFDIGETNTSTDSLGAYSIAMLAAGSYTIRFMAPAASTQTTPAPAAVNIQSGSTGTGIDFGLYRYGTISGLVFDDIDADGAKDSNESGHPGVTVFLDTNTNATLDTGEVSTVTDGSGAYSFTGLTSATYNVRQVVPSGYVTTSPNPRLSGISSGISDSINFAIANTGVISGVVYNDANGNATKDLGEAGLSNMTVFIDSNSNGNFNAGEPSTTTDSSGNYSLTGLSPANYAVRSVVPAGNAQTTANPAAVAVVAGTTVANISFGFFTQGTISGTVFTDTNGNGIHDGGEGGATGKTVYLDANSNNALSAGEPTMLTDSNGNYSFTGLAAGNYRVRMVLPANSSQTTTAPTPQAIASGTVVNGIDFGFFTNGSISGTLFNDVNANGAKDSGDAGLTSKTVYIDANNNGVQDSGEVNTTTAAGGAFTIGNLGPGTYRVRTVIANTQILTTAVPVPIVMSSNLTVSGVDFGTFILGTIAGTVYTDTNGNGLKDTGETGQSGRTVYIDSNNNGALDTGEPNQATGGTGMFLFTGLNVGTYKVLLVLPSGRVQTSVNPFAATIQSGTADTANDFGLFTPATIQGNVYNDTNGTGTRDPIDDGIPGVTVYMDTNNSGTLDTGEASTVSDSVGAFSFTNLSPATYRVRIIVPSGSTQTSLSPAAIAPASGSTSVAQTFGLFMHATLSGTVYDDTNGNGSRDAGEPGLAGRTVYMDANASGTLNTGEPNTVTNSTGAYTFTGLTIGTYRPRTVSPLGSVLTSTQPAAITPTSGQVVTGVNFGMFAQAGISGSVYSDLDGNGARDIGEPGLAGKTVFLDTNNNGTLTAGEPNTTTDGSGNYLFTGLAAGTYRPRVTVAAGNLQTSTSPAPVVAQSGASSAGNDFGLYTLSTITGLVYNDSTANGVKDSTDVGLTPRTVFLDTNANNTLDNGEPNTQTALGGTYTFTGLAPGLYQPKVVVPSGALQTSDDPDPVTTTSGSATGNNDFGIFVLGTLSGVAYSDVNGNGTKGSAEPTIQSRTIYIDSNNNNTFDLGEPSTTTNSSGAYSFTGLVYGTYRVKLVAVSGSAQTSIDPTPVAITSGTNYTTGDFGVFLLATITGTIYSDTNGNGKHDAGELGLGGVTTFLDNNNNNVPDGSEPVLVSDANGAYVFPGLFAGSYKVRVIAPSLTSQTTPVLAAIATSSASVSQNNDIGIFIQGKISGTVYDDLNGTSFKDPNELGVSSATVFLDTNSNGIFNSGEPFQLTDSSGGYQFIGLGFNTYKPRVVLPSGRVMSTPVPSPVSIFSTSNITGIDFGLFTPAVIGGTLFIDIDGNGVRDAGEPVITSKPTLWLDTNLNGLKDTGEPSVIATVTGTYSFINLLAGSYNVRLTLPTTPANLALTAPLPSAIVATSGLVRSNVDFGMRVPPPPTTTTTSTIPGQTTTTSTTIPVPTNPPPADAASAGTGYYMLSEDGDVFAFGRAPFLGSAAPFQPAARTVGMSTTYAGDGYHIVGEDGGIFSFGNAKFLGSMGGKKLNQPMVGIAETPTGNGYWTVARDGGVFSYGDAAFYGSTGAMKLNQPIVQMVATSSGKGYWLVASDGGIFAFGDAKFFGSTGSLKLNKPIVGMARDRDTGYWLVASDGGVFAFGSAGFFGSTGSLKLNQPIVSMRSKADGTGYWMIARDGGVFAFGTATFFGGVPPARAPIVD